MPQSLRRTDCISWRKVILNLNFLRYLFNVLRSKIGQRPPSFFGKVAAVRPALSLMHRDSPYSLIALQKRADYDPSIAVSLPSIAICGTTTPSSGRLEP